MSAAPSNPRAELSRLTERLLGLRSCCRQRGRAARFDKIGNNRLLRGLRVGSASSRLCERASKVCMLAMGIGMPQDALDAVRTALPRA